MEYKEIELKDVFLCMEGKEPLVIGKDFIFEFDSYINNSKYEFNRKIDDVIFESPIKKIKIDPLSKKSYYITNKDNILNEYRKNVYIGINDYKIIEESKETEESEKGHFLNYNVYKIKLSNGLTIKTYDFKEELVFKINELKSNDKMIDNEIEREETLKPFFNAKAKENKKLKWLKKQKNAGAVGITKKYFPIYKNEFKVKIFIGSEYSKEYTHKKEVIDFISNKTSISHYNIESLLKFLEIDFQNIKIDNEKVKISK